MARKYGVPDADNPEWTPQDFAASKPGAEAFRRYRGTQRAPRKQMISLRVDPTVLEAYKVSGKGWQGRMNQTLALHAPRRRRAT